MLYEVWIIREITVFPMLEHEHTLWLQQILLENELWNGGQFLQGIGRVGEDEIKLLLARLDETKHITTQRHADIRP